MSAVELEYCSIPKKQRFVDVLFSDNGFEKLFSDQFKDEIKFSNKNSYCNINGYIWNYELSLWIPISFVKLKTSILGFFKDIRTLILQDSRDFQTNSDINIDKRLNKMYNKIQVSTFTHSLLKFIEKNTPIDTYFINNLNKKKDELPIKNGKIINLRTLEISDRNIHDLWTGELNVEYVDEYLKAETYINTVFQNSPCDPKGRNSQDSSQYRTIQRLFGYYMTGETINNPVIHYGKGCNGRDTLFKIFSNIMGQYQFRLELFHSWCIEQYYNISNYRKCISSGKAVIISNNNKPTYYPLNKEDKDVIRSILIRYSELSPICVELIIDQTLKTYLVIDYPTDFSISGDPDFINKLDQDFYNQMFSWFCVGQKCGIMINIYRC